MADIKQAADWLDEGRRIMRKLWSTTSAGWPLWIAADEGDEVVREDTGAHFQFYTYDLKATDWELADRQ